MQFRGVECPPPWPLKLEEATLARPQRLNPALTTILRVINALRMRDVMLTQRRIPRNWRRVPLATHATLCCARRDRCCIAAAVEWWTARNSPVGKRPAV